MRCKAPAPSTDCDSPAAAAAALLQWNVVVTSVAAHCATAVGRARVEQWIDVDSALAATQQDAERRLAQTAAAAQLPRLPAGEGGMMLGEGGHVDASFFSSSSFSFLGFFFLKKKT